MKTSSILAGITLLTCISAALAGSNNVYKWKDKNGVIHYSQTAPQGQEVQVITTKTPRDPLPEEMTQGQATTPTGGVAQPSQSKKDAPPPVAQKDPETCEKAQKAVQDLQKPIIMNEGKIMTIDEKNAEIQKMQEVIKVHCP